MIVMLRRLGPAPAPGAESTGQAQILDTLGTPFVLAGLFGEADAAALDPPAGNRDDTMQVEPLADIADAGMNDVCVVRFSFSYSCVVVASAVLTHTPVHT